MVATYRIDCDDWVYDWKKLNLQSLDNILCAGSGKLSNRIEKFQLYTGASPEAARITHVAGIAGRYDTSVQESTTLNWDGTKGVQEHTMEEWLPHYNGMVYVRKMDFDRTKEYHDKDWDYWESVKGKKYENGVPGDLELLLCGLRLHRYIRKVFPNYVPHFTDEPHCTELQGNRIKTHGKLITTAVTNRMPPWCWWGHTLDGILTCPIGPPIRIK